LDPHYGQILLGIALGKAHLGSDDVPDQYGEPRVREIPSHQTKAGDDIRHDGFIDSDFAGYAFSVELGHGKPRSVTTQNAMEARLVL
jgi:hypothetical protein